MSDGDRWSSAAQPDGDGCSRNPAAWPEIHPLGAYVSAEMSYGAAAFCHAIYHNRVTVKLRCFAVMTRQRLPGILLCIAVSATTPLGSVGAQIGTVGYECRCWGPKIPCSV
jgi:hypothetical protein